MVFLAAEDSGNEFAKRPKLISERRPSMKARIRPSSETRSLYTERSRPSSLSDDSHVYGPRGSVLVSDFNQPKSQYHGWHPPFPVSCETDAISEFLEAGDTKWIEMILDHFTVYRKRKSDNDHGMVPLHDLNVKSGDSELFFDGVLLAGKKRHYLQAQPFKILAIDGYGECSPSVYAIWIQTPYARAKNVWYRLGKPSAEYLRFYKAFCWVANFGKLFVDYLLEHDSVKLVDFRFTFYKWLLQKYDSHPKFQQWYHQYGRSDFRNAVSAYAEYLWKEATNIYDELRRHLIWKEVDPLSLSAVRPQPLCESKTVVTPFVYECFKDSYFAKVLESRASSDQGVVTAQRLRKSLLGFQTDPITPPSSTSPSPTHTSKSEVNRGSVVSVLRDAKSQWKDKAELWFGTCFIYFFLSLIEPVNHTMTIIRHQMLTTSQHTCVPFMEID
jgi:DNA (cytosine-5)-methyltransferase 1